MGILQEGQKEYSFAKKAVYLAQKSSWDDYKVSSKEK